MQYTYTIRWICSKHDPIIFRRRDHV